jgi:VWFA-related protein
MATCATWFLLPAALLSAQENVIRVDTRLVQVNVVVHDKDGAPVDNLTREDFTVFDKGKLRPISFFSLDRLNAPPPAAQPLPANLFGNDPASQARRPAGVTIVLLDGTNTRLTDQSYARQQLARFLSRLNPNDQVALYALGNSLRILQDFTSDSGQLLAFLDQYRGASSAELSAGERKTPATGVPIIDAILREMDAAFSDQMQAIRIRRTYEALAAIAGHVEHVPGRKNLVWLSSAFPLTMGLDDPSAFRNPRRLKEAFAEERAHAVSALVRANVAIYPVDARGLVGGPVSMAAEASSSGRTRTSLPAAVIKGPAAGVDTMEELASATGGRAFHDTNDLAAAVRSAVNDSAITYTLGFYPDPGGLDGKFHELNVKLKRKGVNLRYRKGYIAYPDSPPAPEQCEAALRMALWSPLPSTGITLLARAERFDKPEPNVLQVAVIADAHQVRLSSNGGRWTGRLEVVFGQLDSEGRVLESMRDAVNLNLDAPTHEEIMKSGILLARALKPVESATQVRVVVYDHLTSALGSLIIPLSGIQ